VAVCGLQFDGCPVVAVPMDTNPSFGMRTGAYEENVEGIVK
jgi:hypothetical protein